MNRRASTALGVAALALALVLGRQVLQAQASATVGVDGATQFQVIDGFGVSANVNSWNGGELRPALDLLVDQLGATIWRVVIDNGDWEATNDNSDPNVFNWTYYNGIYTTAKFEELWSTIGYLNQKGVSDRLMLNVMGPVAGWMGGSRINVAAEDEWVEMIASLVYYGRVTRGLRFTLLAPLNETDNDGIEGPLADQWQFARLFRKVAVKLDAVGLGDIRLVGPDTVAIGDGVGSYMPELMTDSLVMSKLDHFAFHNYAGDSGGADQAIRNSAYPTKNFWITEVSNIWDALAHIGQGPSATLVWDGYDSVYNHAILNGRGSTPPNDAGNGPALLAYSQSSGVYTPRKAFYQHAQLFRFVRPGARRVGTTVSGSGLTIYAFNDLSLGRVTIVGRNGGTGSRTINGSLSNLLSISSFAFYQTTASTDLQRGADVAVTNNTFSVQVAGGGVFTLVASTVPDTVSPTVSITGPSGVVSGTVTVSATASDNVGVLGVQFLLDGIALGSEDTQAPYQVTWDTRTATPGAHQLTARARDQAGNTRVSDAVTVTVDNSDVTPPVVSVTAPAAGASVSATVTVTAAATDNVGVARVQFLLDGVALGSEDTSAPYAVSWNTSLSSNGSHGLAARAWDATGNVTTSATVSVTVANSGTSPMGLVAAYGFGENGGSFVSDASGQGHTGTISGAAWSAAGRYGAALSFDGVNDRVAVADSNALDLTTGMTLEAWARPSANGAWRTVVLKESTGGLAYALYSSTDTSRPAGYITIFSDIGLSGSSALALDTWTHVAVTYDGAALRLYVNATQVSSQSQTGSIATSSSPLSFGGNTVWGEYFAGLIDEVRIYNRALTAAEIQSDMNTPIDTTTDTTPPQLAVTAPAGGATVSGVGTITATASDNVGVVGVQFLVDGVAAGAEDTTAPYGVSWDSTSVGNGTHTVTARARDAAGNTTTSAGVTVTVANTDTAPPSVAVSAPSAGATVSGTVTLSATASDNVGVVGVQFLIDGVAAGAEDTTAPFSISWSSTSVGNGTHSVTARARDAAGNTTTSAAVTATVSNADTAPPSVTVSAPSPGATVSGTVTLSATASDNVGVVGVQFLVDGVAAGAEDTTAPYSVSWTSTSVGNGTHSVTARARDAAGNATTSAGVTVTVANADTAPPSVALTAPAAGATVSGTVTMSATATDNVGVVGVQFLVDGAAAGAEDTTAPYSVTWNSTTVVNGTHTVTARARDAAGNTTTSAGVTVTVSNTDSSPPSVAVTAPAAGATVSGTVTLSATASDNVGVVGIQFLVDGVAAGTEDTTAPYGVSWNSTSVGNGTHSVTARARDAAGNVTTSAAVPVTVSNGSGSLTVTLASIGADDGVLVESSEISNIAGLVDSTSATIGALRIGDLSSDAQLKSILSFDTSAIPAGATVLSGRVRVRSGEARGTSPFLTHGAAQVDLRQGWFGSTRALEGGDFAATPSAAAVATLSAPAAIGDWSEGTLTTAGLAALNRNGVTQFRLAFTLDDDDDNTADFVGYRGGDDPDPASRPQLIVTYSGGGASNTAPLITITGPANGSSFSSGTAIPFSGTATDAEDGLLTAGLQWTSNRDGVLGTGAAVQAVLTQGTHTVTASVTDSGGLLGTASIGVTVTSSGSPISSTLVSIGADDGLVLETAENSNQGGLVDSTTATGAALRMGDTDADAQYKSVLSFDTSGIPAGATILSATVRVRRAMLRGGDPFITHGTAGVDIRTGVFGSSAALEPGDFQAALTAAGVAVLSAPATDGAWAEGTLSAAGLAALNRSGLTQFRLAFARDDDDDATADFIGFRSADDADVASRPQLIVVYQQ